MIHTLSCVYLTCDGAENCDPWEEGIPHFPTAEDAVSYARSYGWVIVGDKALCREHAVKADCAATTHQYDEWRDKEFNGVRYRTRWCEHCCETDYDPPFNELSLLMHAARELAGGSEVDRA